MMIDTTLKLELALYNDMRRNLEKLPGYLLVLMVLDIIQDMYWKLERINVRITL